MKWKTILLVIVLGILNVIGTSRIAIAATSSDVTITVTPILVGGVTDFVITYINDQQLDMTWAYTGGAVNVMIRGKYGAYPDDIPDEDTEPSDGYLVYYGSGTTTSDTTMDFDQSTGAIYYKVWGQKADGKWYLYPDTGWKESEVLTLIGIIAFCGILSFLAIRSTFFGLKLLAGMSWFAFFVYFKASPPSVITEGSATHTAFLIVAIGFGLMIVLSGWQRGLRSTKSMSEGLTVTKEEAAWHLPEWMNGEDNEYEEYQKNRQKEIEDYRNRIHKAAYNRKR